MLEDRHRASQFPARARSLCDGLYDVVGASRRKLGIGALAGVSAQTPQFPQLFCQCVPSSLARFCQCATAWRKASSAAELRRPLLLRSSGTPPRSELGWREMWATRGGARPGCILADVNLGKNAPPGLSTRLCPFLLMPPCQRGGILPTGFGHRFTKRLEALPLSGGCARGNLVSKVDHWRFSEF